MMKSPLNYQRLMVIVIVLSLSGLIFIWNTNIPKCLIPEGQFTTFKSMEIDRPVETGIKSIFTSKSCFGQVEQSDVYGRTKEVTEHLQQYSYPVFINTRRFTALGLFVIAVFITAFIFKPKNEKKIKQ